MELCRLVLSNWQQFWSFCTCLLNFKSLFTGLLQITGISRLTLIRKIVETKINSSIILETKIFFHSLTSCRIEIGINRLNKMYSHQIRQYTSKFCQCSLMKQILKTVCTNYKNLFLKNIATTSTTTKGNVKNSNSFDPPSISKKEIEKTNFLQNTVRRLFSITGMLRNKFLIRKYFCKNPLTTKDLLNHRRHTAAHSFGGAIGNSSIISNLHPRSIQISSVRTFASSSGSEPNSYDANYDFPINPIPNRSKSFHQLKKSVSYTPIAQNYMPFTMTGTRNQSEQVYRKIRNSCKSLVADLIYSFPFNTHSERTREFVVPTLDGAAVRKSSLNTIIDKMSPKPKHSIWSITDNFSFPNINRRFEIETLMKPNVDDDSEEIPIANIWTVGFRWLD